MKIESNDFVKSKIMIFFNNVNNENISDKINIVKSIYEEILELNISIENTNFISLDDLSSLKQESNDIKKLHRLQKEKIYKFSKKNKDKYSREEYNIISDEIQSLEYVNSNKSFKYLITQRYYSFTNKIINNILNKDLIISGLEIIKFNIKKKKRLNKIFDKYHSEKFVIELLSELYQKEIELI